MYTPALIVTLQMEARAAARFTALRRAHFPPERNWLDAHITLFHALPMSARDAVLGDIADIAANTDLFALRVERLLFLGAGVAYALASAEAWAVRDALARCWSDLLGRQDSHRRRPLHVTVQNKVSPAEARLLLADLERNFSPASVDAIGLQVWEYRGGPWLALKTLAFQPAQISAAHEIQH